MYPKPTEVVEKYRIRSGPMGSDARYGNNGVFIFPSPFRSTLKTIVSDELGWEHVSVSVHRQKRTPTWEEMCFVKDLFWQEDECVIQYHPPRDDYVNCHPYVLHLWRPIAATFPRPPHTMVGPKTPVEAIRLARDWGN